MPTQQLTGGSIVDLAVPFALLLAADAMKKGQGKGKDKDKRDKKGGAIQPTCALCRAANANTVGTKGGKKTDTKTKAKPKC